jgi:exodeoxyribonuclease VII large subunit
LPENPLFEHLFAETERRPMTVSELNSEVRSILERRFASVWVEGEVTGFTRAASGHWYFGLNDGNSQIKAVCWKGTNYRIRFRPENGVTVRVRGRLSLYEPRGEFQLVVESLEPSGEGALRAAFEQIKARLDAEGLFRPELKRPIPFFPRRVAVITSPSGAAYHDIHNVLTRRARSVSILLIPAQVQGEGSADSIRRAVTDANTYNLSLEERDRIDVLIVGRGGGSAEDLWAFNDEALARAIRASEIPVISAVGHEIDWTICDWVADLRAATPSAAAELVAQREDEIDRTFEARDEQLQRIIYLRMLETTTRTNHAIDALKEGFADRVIEAKGRFDGLAARISPSALSAKLAAIAGRLDIFEQRRIAAIAKLKNGKDESLNLIMAKLDAMSPLAVLTRGYSITQTEDGKVLRDPAKVKPGDKLCIRLERGKLDAEVLAS